jgi:hypothetical protein
LARSNPSSACGCSGRWSTVPWTARSDSGPPAHHDFTKRSLRCCYPITGGLLAHQRGGEIHFPQDQVDDQLWLRSIITGFFPALAARPGEPDWTGALYSQVQRRIRLAISRRYFSHLIGEAGQ